MILSVFTACSSESDATDSELNEDKRWLLNSCLEDLEGKGLEYGEMMDHVDKFFKLKDEYEGQKIGWDDEKKENVEIHLEIIKPDELSEDYLYDIDLLPKEYDVYEGIAITVAGPVSDAEPSESEETEESEPAEEITPEPTPTPEPEVTTTTTQQGYWALTDTRVVIAVPHNAVEEYQTSYDASEYAHEYIDLLPETDAHDRQYVRFVSYCSAAPQEIRPGDVVAFTVILDMDDQATYSFESTAYVCFVGGYDGTSDFAGGINFQATQEGAPDKCYVDTNNNYADGSIEVAREFTEVGSAGDYIAIVFYGCESTTMWVYTWVE